MSQSFTREKIREIEEKTNKQAKTKEKNNIGYNRPKGLIAVSHF